MRAVLVFVCFVSLAFAGCGGDGGGDDGINNDPGPDDIRGGDACESICSSPCVDEVGLDGMELAECVDACQMSGLGFDQCLPEASALLQCAEQFPNCEPTGLNCSGEAIAFGTCFGF